MSAIKIHPATMLKLRHLAEYGAFQAVLFLVRSLPIQASVRMAHGLAWLVHHVLPRRMTRYKVCRDNLNLAFGDSLSDADADLIILGMWRHLFRMVCEIIQMPRRFRLSNCADVLEFVQRNETVQALCTGRPILFLGGHFGNWEISVNTFGHFGFPTGVVARPLDNPYLHNWFKRFRESTGNFLIDKQGASTDLTDILEHKGIATLLCDQDAGRSGVFVDFFGRPASTFKSIALLALQYNALIVVGGAYRLPEAEQLGARWVRFRLTTQDIIDPADFQGSSGVTELTQKFTSSLEGLIRRAPEQYFWLHRRWKTPPDARRRARKEPVAA